MVNLELGAQGEEFEFLVDTGADKSCIIKLPKGCKVGKTMCQVMGAKGEPFKASIIGNVIIKGNSRETR